MGKLLLFFAFAAVLSQALSEYYISTEALSFMQAYATCKRNKYTLARERSLEDSDALNSAIKKAKATTHDFFIGGMYDFTGIFTPVWLWVEDGEEITYDHWASGASQTSECLVRSSLTTGDGYWLSSSCTESRYFICEY
ncbi:hypothetical protein HUJ04_013195 [Dendroctonus ponderosae]